MSLPIITAEHVLGVDLGGSNVRVVISDGAGQTIARTTEATVRGDAHAVLAQLVVLSRRLVHRAELDWSSMGAMAVGVPGVVHLDGRELRLSPNLPSFVDVDVAARLGEQLELPVAVDNDVNLATLAEHRHGIAVGRSEFVFIAVGTGIGMGIVASGRLQRGVAGAAGEIAFLPLGADPFDPANQVHGPLEEVAGGVGVARRYAALAGEDPVVVDTAEVFRRAEHGDAHARAVLDDQARAVALAVTSAQSMLDPGLVVFGGGIGTRPDFVARVRDEVSRLTTRPPTIALSGLGTEAGLLGAAELARTSVLPRALDGHDGNGHG